jgi:hypothetical protein
MIGNRTRSGPKDGPKPLILSTVFCRPAEYILECHINRFDSDPRFQHITAHAISKVAVIPSIKQFYGGSET